MKLPCFQCFSRKSFSDFLTQEEATKLAEAEKKAFKIVKMGPERRQTIAWGNCVTTWLFGC